MKIPLLVLVSSMALALPGQSPSPAKTPGPEPSPTPAVEETPLFPLVEFSVFVWPSNKVLLEDSPISGIPRVFYDAPDGTLLATVLPYESEQLKSGMARIYNSSDLNLVFQFGDENGPLLKLPPNNHIDFDPKTMSDSEYPRIFGYRLDERGNPTLIHTSKLYFEQEKTIFFVLYPQGNRIRIMRLGGHELRQAPAPDGVPPGPAAL